MKKMLISLCFLLLLVPLLAEADTESAFESYRAVVANPQVADRLILRKTPSSDGEVLGRFYSGTELIVTGETGEWAQVAIGDAEVSMTGYMKLEFLMKANRNHGAPSRFYLSYAATENSPIYTKKNTRSALTGRVGHAGVYVLGDIGDDWRFVFSESDGYGYVRTSHLKAPNVDFDAWLQSLDGQPAPVYADSECTREIALYDSTVQLRVVGLSRAKGWAKVEIRGDRSNPRYDVFNGRFITGYVRQENLIVFKQPWEMLYTQRTACAVQDIAARDEATLRAFSIPAGARLTILGQTAEGECHIVYGGDELDTLYVAFVSPQSLKTESYVSSIYQDVPRQGYLLLRHETDADGWTLETCGYAAPDEAAEATYQLYQQVMELVAVLPNGWYQARDFHTPCVYIRPEDADPLYLDWWLTPDTPEGETESLYVFSAPRDAAASITLKNTVWGLNATYEVRNGDYTLFIPKGTEITQSGGTLKKMRVDALEPLVSSCSNPEETVIFQGSGRFFCDQQILDHINFYSYKITPLTSESYYAIPNLSTMENDSVHEILAEDEVVYLNLNVLPGSFLEVHNCTIEITYGNG